MNEKDKNKKKVHQPDDKLFKSVMSEPENAAAYLKKFYPELAKKLELSTLTIDPTSYIDGQLRAFSSDIIYRVEFKDTTEEECIYLSLLWEHKSTPDDGVILRVGFYIFSALYKLYYSDRKKFAPILPLIFYNGESNWIPKTLPDLFKSHPFFEDLERYIPKFDYEFLNITDIPIAELLALEVRFFRSAMYSMAHRNKVDLLLEKIVFILEGQTQRNTQTLIHYIFGRVERSPKHIQELFDQLDFTTKTSVMSTLEQFEARGIKKGQLLERKNALFKELRTLLNLLDKLPNLSTQELAVITLMEEEKIEKVKALLSIKNIRLIESELITLFFTDLPLVEEDRNVLAEIVEAYLK